MGGRFVTQIEPGQAIKVRLRTAQSKRTFLTYVTRVDPEYLEIAVPLDEPGLLARSTESPLEISFLKQGLYLRFQTWVQSQVQSGRHAWLVRSPAPDTVEIVNRRGQSRCPLKIAVLCHQASLESDQEKCSKGYLMDLSLGGARLLCDDPLSSICPLSLEFYLDQIQEPVLLQGRVVRQVHQPPKRYGYGVCFHAVPEQYRESLMEFLR